MVKTMLEQNVDSRKSGLGIKSLPSSLEESLTALKSDLNYLRVCFQMELIETYIRLNEDEMREIGKNKLKTRQFMLYYDI